ncbi:LOW QUALITY PROTEIN: starch-binding domain-containing protein 1 [Myiozetetes cayanensis]|uniref:LOW QUALITY PROTEIN: starch-binding domain-containing protein 1 n=1 Tax=Myiozetetes cayanensis TaxID=478635 RepID=UPI00215F16D8|nr:LOW QUALITY PROTEIN: starch-binding domain-containing protein 1 [Myiozetetes cayanensis]
MARDRGPPVVRPPGAAALPAEPRAWGWLGAGLWPAGLLPALLVGLLAAVLAWFWYGGSDGRGEAEGGEAAAAGGEGPRRASGEPAATGDAAASAEPVRREVAAAVPGAPKPGEDLAAAPREEINHVQSGAVWGQPVEVEIPKQDATDARKHADDTAGSQAGEPGAQVGQASDGWCVMNLAGASEDDCKARSEEQSSQPAESRDLDHEEWEVVSEHLVEGEAGKDGSVEDSDSREWEQGDCCDGDLKAKRVAAVPPMFQNIHVAFRVHYITHSEAQLIGVTGDHECLGQWHSYVPLKRDKDGFWSESISLPADTRLEWKFILVENGKVRRWEECGNRTLVTEHEDQIVHQWWGYH